MMMMMVSSGDRGYAGFEHAGLHFLVSLEFDVEGVGSSRDVVYSRVESGSCEKVEFGIGCKSGRVSVCLDGIGGSGSVVKLSFEVSNKIVRLFFNCGSSFGVRRLCWNVENVAEFEAGSGKCESDERPMKIVGEKHGVVVLRRRSSGFAPRGRLVKVDQATRFWRDEAPHLRGTQRFVDPRGSRSCRRVLESLVAYRLESARPEVRARRQRVRVRFANHRDAPRSLCDLEESGRRRLESGSSRAQRLFLGPRHELPLLVTVSREFSETFQNPTFATSRSPRTRRTRRNRGGKEFDPVLVS